MKPKKLKATATHRLRKSPPPPDYPAKECPNCGQEWAKAIPGTPGTYVYAPAQKVPHENPFDCIRHLRKVITDMASDVSEVRYLTRADDR